MCMRVVRQSCDCAVSRGQEPSLRARLDEWEEGAGRSPQLRSRPVLGSREKNWELPCCAQAASAHADTPITRHTP